VRWSIIQVRIVICISCITGFVIVVKNLFKLMLIRETPIQLKERTCGNIVITQYVAFALENNIFIISINHEL